MKVSISIVVGEALVRPFFFKVESHYCRTSLIRTPRGQSEVSVLERCPYERGHYNDVTSMTSLRVLSV